MSNIEFDNNFIIPPQAIIFTNGEKPPDRKPEIIKISVPDLQEDASDNENRDGFIITVQLLPEWVRTEEGRNFQVLRSIAKSLARKGYQELSRESTGSIRFHNQGQFGDTFGSSYLLEIWKLVTTNRDDRIDFPEEDSPVESIKKGFKDKLVSTPMQVPVIIMANRDGKTIKFLPASQAVLDGSNKPARNFFKPKDVLNLEELSVYNLYHGKTGRLERRTRQILFEAEGTLARFHRVYSLEEFITMQQ